MGAGGASSKQNRKRQRKKGRCCCRPSTCLRYCLCACLCVFGAATLANHLVGSTLFRGSIFAKNVGLSLRGLATLFNIRGDPCKYDAAALVLGANAFKEAADIKREQLRCRLDKSSGMYFSNSERGPVLCKCKQDPERGFNVEKPAGTWAEAPCDAGNSGKQFAAPGGMRRRYCGIDPKTGRAHWDAEKLPDNSQCSFASWPTCQNVDAADVAGCQASVAKDDAAAMREGGQDLHILWGVGTHRNRRLVDGCAAFASPPAEAGWKQQGAGSGLPGALRMFRLSTFKTMHD